LALPCYVIDRTRSVAGGGAPGGGLGGFGSPVSLAPPVSGGGLGAPSSAAGGDGVPKSDFEGQMVFPITKHCCNDQIDVVQFEVAVVIDNTQIQNFINALQSEKTTELKKEDGSVENTHRRNQITVLTIRISPIQANREKDAGYYYGYACLNELRLICEYVFFKDGYEKKKPEPVKKFIVSNPSAMGVGGMGGGMGMPGGMEGERGRR